MNSGELRQGQALLSLGLPDYNAEGARPWSAGDFGCKSITVIKLAGPMGWYDCARVDFSDNRLTQIIPLHHCNYIVPAPAASRDL